MIVNIPKFLNGKNAISYEDGEKLCCYLTRHYNIINILESEDIIIDFGGLEILTAPFMNASIFEFITNNKESIDCLYFIDSTLANNEVNIYTKMLLKNIIPMALDDKLRAKYYKSIEDISKTL